MKANALFRSIAVSCWKLLSLIEAQLWHNLRILRYIILLLYFFFYIFKSFFFGCNLKSYELYIGCWIVQLLHDVVIFIFLNLCRNNKPWHTLSMAAICWGTHDQIKHTWRSGSSVACSSYLLIMRDQLRKLKWVKRSSVAIAVLSRFIRRKVYSVIIFTH